MFIAYQSLCPKQTKTSSFCLFVLYVCCLSVCLSVCLPFSSVYLPPLPALIFHLSSQTHIAPILIFSQSSALTVLYLEHFWSKCRKRDKYTDLRRQQIDKHICRQRSRKPPNKKRKPNRSRRGETSRMFTHHPPLIPSRNRNYRKTL